MKYRLLNAKPTRTFLLTFGKDDEVMAELLLFAAKEKLRASSISGIGALSGLIYAFYDPQTKDYRKINLQEQVELLSMLGNLFTHEGKHKIHAHVTVATADGHAFGGHLFEAHARPVVELFMTEFPFDIQRQFDPDSCLPLIAF